MELTPDGIDLIRVRNSDKTAPESKQVKSDGWQWYIIPFLAPDGYYGGRFTPNQDPEYHTNPGFAIGIETSVKIPLPVTPLTPPPPAILSPWPDVRQRSYLPHQHTIPTMIGEIRPFRLIYREAG